MAIHHYLEFRINGIVGSFLDLSSIFMELHLKPVVAATCAALADDVVVAFLNALSNTIFKSVPIFINEKMVKVNPFFNYSAYVKLLKKLDSSQVT